jgi:hypothetical protein
MNWNDRGGRLESLEINRGERLLIKNAEKFNLPKSDSQKSSSAAPAQSPAAFAIGSPSDLFVGLLAAPANEPPRRQQMYYATFDKDVRVNRDGTQLAAADVMRVILPLGDAKAAPAKPVPNEETRAQRARRRAAATSPAAERALAAADDEKLGVRKPTTKPATHTTTPNAATLPIAGGPVEVLWTGKLTVLPVERVPDAPKDPAQMVELLGAPAWVAENGSRAEARLIHLEPDTGKIRLEPGGPVKAIAVHDARGADLRTRNTLFVDRTAGTATVNGGGTLVAPANPPTQPDATTISWSRRLVLQMTDTPQPTLKQVTIEGEAKIDSATLDVTSDTLALGFGEPTKHTEPVAADSATAGVALPAADLSALRSVVATGGANIAVGKDAATRRTLAAQKIDLGFVPLDTGTGLKTVKCNDAVQLSDASGFSLACATLDATLKPTSIDQPTDTSPTQNKADPLADLDAMVATGAVSLRQADGSNASGDRVELTHVGDTKKMTLTGAPASVGSAKGSLEGQLILIDPASGDVNVPGPGRFVGTGEVAKDQMAAPKSPATMAIAWLESMNAVGSTGVCDLVGGVHIDGTSDAGTHLTATAQRGRINFTPRQQMSTSTTKPAAMADASLDAVRSIQLSGAVDVATEAVDVRTSSIQTEQIDIDLENSIVTAPQAGRLLVIDGKRATTQPTTEIATGDTSQPATQSAPRGMKRGPGSLAIAWKQQLVWKMREGDLTFDGGVRLGFEKAGSNDPIRLSSERVICALAPIQTGKGVDQMSQRIDLRTVTAQQNVTVRSRQASFDAASLMYDAVTNRATATGEPNTPVEVFDADGTSRMSFSAITWNVDTGLIEDFRDIDGRLRR